MKIAIVHPWFLMRGGGEKVVDVLAEMYPSADIYSLFVNPKMLSPILRNRGVHPSILNAFPFSSKLHRQLLPLYPFAVESLDLRAYDLVISSCGPAMMGCNIRQDAVHICYCHTPQRSWWDLYSEHQLQLSLPLRYLFVLAAARVRTWEFSAMQRVDHVISNSHYIADRVFRYFRRESSVIYPPVSTAGKPALSHTGSYYLSVARLETQKRIDILIRACNALGRKLVIVGTGKKEAYLKSIAGPTIEFLGYVPDALLPDIYANCKAFVFAALEDFGISPIEAQSYGKPVIAFGQGGSLETVRVNDPDGLPDTGLFFQEQTPESVAEAILRFESLEYQFAPSEIHKHALGFDTAVFSRQFTEFVDMAMKAKEMRAPALRKMPTGASVTKSASDPVLEGSTNQLGDRWQRPLSAVIGEPISK